MCTPRIMSPVVYKCTAALEWSANLVQPGVCCGSKPSQTVAQCPCTVQSVNIAAEVPLLYTCTGWPSSTETFGTTHPNVFIVAAWSKAEPHVPYSNVLSARVCANTHQSLYGCAACVAMLPAVMSQSQPGRMVSCSRRCVQARLTPSQHTLGATTDQR